MENLPQIIEFLLENGKIYTGFKVDKKDCYLFENIKSTIKYSDFLKIKEGDLFIGESKILKIIDSNNYPYELESIKDIYREEQAIKNKDMNDIGRIIKSWEWLYDLAGSACSLELTEDEMLELIKDYVYDKDFKFVNNKNKEVKIYPYTIVFYSSSDNREMYDDE